MLEVWEAGEEVCLCEEQAGQLLFPVLQADGNHQEWDCQEEVTNKFRMKFNQEQIVRVSLLRLSISIVRDLVDS